MNHEKNKWNLKQNKWRARERQRETEIERQRERENIQRQVTFTLEHQHHFVFSITDKGPQSLELPKRMLKLPTL